ncbi:MAG: GIY-YIG nuclease family protein [Emcibacteraceae bacterium]|nr:GIY-YIG nuclease family protein [Emcibacteraceae bacterium]
MNKTPFIYIMASEMNGTLYIGVTSDLVKRVWQHKNGTFEGFSKQYKTNMLVYYEQLDTMEQAIIREKQLKEWKRMWKMRIIMEMNPNWDDLYGSICS